MKNFRIKANKLFRASILAIGVYTSVGVLSTKSVLGLETVLLTTVFLTSVTILVMIFSTIMSEKELLKRRHRLLYVGMQIIFFVHLAIFGAVSLIDNTGFDRVWGLVLLVQLALTMGWKEQMAYERKLGEK